MTEKRVCLHTLTSTSFCSLKDVVVPPGEVVEFYQVRSRVALVFCVDHFRLVVSPCFWFELMYDCASSEHDSCTDV